MQQPPSDLPPLPYAPPAPWAPRVPRLDLSSLTRRDAALDLALVLIVGLLVPVGFQIWAALNLASDATADFDFAPIVVNKWFEALSVTALAAYFIYRHNLPASAFGLQPARLGRQLLWSVPTLLSIYTIMIPFVIVTVFFVLTFPETQSDLQHRVDFIQALPIHNLLVTVLLLIPVAIHEELLFRGLLIPYFRRIGLGWVGAVAFSTLIFASLHLSQGWIGALQIIPIGAVLATFFIISRSLTAVIIAHFLFDLLQTQLARLFPSDIDDIMRQAGQTGSETATVLLQLITGN